MLNLFKIFGTGLWAIASAAFVLSACGTKIAGGVDEETNTVASEIPKDTIPVSIVDTLSNINLIIHKIDSIDIVKEPSQPSSDVDIIRNNDHDTLVYHTIVKCGISNYKVVSYELSLQ